MLHANFVTNALTTTRRAAPWLGLSAVLIVGGCSSGPFAQNTVSACQQTKQYKQVRVDTLALHDYDGDGKVDMVVACAGSGSSGVSGSGYVEMYKGDGEGGFEKVAEKDLPDRRVSHFGLANMDGGAAKLMVSFQTPHTRYLSRLPYSAGNGFGDVTDLYSTGMGVGTFVQSDVNGDGTPDFVLPGEDSWLQTIPAGTNNTFRRHHLVNSRTKSARGTLDVNGDGRMDATRGLGRGGQIHVYIGGGSMKRVYPGKATRGIDRVVGAGDFNGDGKTDFVVRMKTYPDQPGHLELALAGDNDNMTLSKPIKGFDDQRVVFVADFDGDGNPDIAYTTHDEKQSGEDGYALHIVHGQGGTQFGKPTDIAIDSYLYNATAADVNGDGKPDIVYSSNLKNNDIKVLLNQSQHA